MITEEVLVRHAITDKEMAALAREQAQALYAKQVAEKELESIRNAYKAKITEAEAAVTAKSATIQAGFEMKTVRCLIANERPEGYRLTIRLDTGHVVRRRKLEESERQIKITDINDPFIAVALLKVDDENWDADVFQCPIRQDEFDALRQLPDVQMADMKPVRAHLASGKDVEE